MEEMMEIIDITIKLDENTPIYAGDPRFVKEVWRTVQEDTYMLSKLRMGSHTGTHVDAPCHFINGAKAVYHMPLRKFVGPCKVYDSFEDYDGKAIRVLFKGRTKLTPEMAAELVKNRVELVGTEAASIGDDETHKILLGTECVALEWLNLAKAEAGEYFLCAQPLKIDADGSPVRACLVKDIETGE